MSDWALGLVFFVVLVGLTITFATYVYTAGL